MSEALLQYRLHPALDRDQPDANDPAFCPECSQDLSGSHDADCDYAEKVLASIAVVTRIDQPAGMRLQLIAGLAQVALEKTEATS